MLCSMCIFVSCFLRFWSDELSVIKIVDKYVFLWNVWILITVQIPLDYIMTESEKVNLLCGSPKTSKLCIALFSDKAGTGCIPQNNGVCHIKDSCQSSLAKLPHLAYYLQLGLSLGSVCRGPLSTSRICQPPGFVCFFAGARIAGI